MSMPSPILILGDRYLSQNNINDAKRKYNDYKWFTFSAKNDSVDGIRAASGQNEFIPTKKVILIKDIPNKKQVRQFLLDLVESSSERLKFIIWDSTGTIAIDPKKKTFNKTWSQWISELKKNKNHKIVNNGIDFSHKENNGCVSFIQSKFEKAKKKISGQNALLLAQIVGRSRGMLASEINKLILTCPQEITKSFILENAFPSSKEAVLYKFGNVLNTASYSDSLKMMEEFIDMGINPNVLAEVMARKARWQLASASLWSQGFAWSDVASSIMEMGKYPSSIWHKKSSAPSEKRKESEGLKTVEDRIKYMIEAYHIKEWQIDSSKKTPRAEVMPMQFMAQLEIKFLQEKILASNNGKYKEAEMRSRLVGRGIKVYLFVMSKLKAIRYGENPQQDLQEMVAALTNKKL